jgi:hypothetical protein
MFVRQVTAGNSETVEKYSARAFAGIAASAFACE